ncbi:lipid droplet-associated protein [Nocardia sp. CDC153]|uniref:lipid droplet-associated protein n=1 Tax=Nocardia sp. CDC153 TaxID=3112167 RepID=UPI002DBD7A0D|nr:lipid droplet-associated protein [Nocardia sp. CDC153]MEC3952075.1 lipid droplet-associated protein [Nocardia sp. CDC153]
MFRPPFLARVAAGAAVYALEETRRLPTTAINFPITAISQMLQTTMHLQQFVTSLALKGDAVFDRLINQPEEQPAWATFDEDEDDEQTPSFASDSVRQSRFDLFTDAESAVQEPVAEPEPAAEPEAVAPEPVVAESAAQEAAEPEVTENPAPAPASTAATNGHNGNGAAAEPEVATRFGYADLSIAQLRARLRQLSVEDLAALLAYEQETRDRAPFVTMLTNRIATVNNNSR